MDTLQQILIRELEKYTGKAFNGYSVLDINRDQSHFVVTSIGSVRGQRVVNTALIVELVGNTIVIDRDIHDKQLVDALVQAGISRQQIVLAYAGEAAPEKV
ncbi:MAG: XisI protein [Anaerolineae bacterium]|nr:XisI protein [Anaerolineae bacterium]